MLNGVSVRTCLGSRLQKAPLSNILCQFWGEIDKVNYPQQHCLFSFISPWGIKEVYNWQWNWMVFLDKKKYTLSGYVINVSILIHSLYRRLDYYKITADGNFLIDVWTSIFLLCMNSTSTSEWISPMVSQWPPVLSKWSSDDLNPSQLV